MKGRYKRMNNITKYRIVYARNYEKSLEDQVIKLIKQGWTPQGGIFVVGSPTGWHYWQAMVKE
jgi:RNA 3'-terminal phosphate cyclase